MWMEAATLAVAAATLLAVLLHVRSGKRRPDDDTSGGTPGEDTAGSAIEPASGPVDGTGSELLELVESRGGAYELRLRGLQEAFVTLTPRPAAASNPPAAVDHFAVRGIRALAEVLPAPQARIVMEGVWQVTFSPATLRMLETGQARLMQSGARTLTKAVSVNSGRVIEQGTIVKGGAMAAGATLSAPLMGLIAVGALAVYSHQRWIDQTLGSIHETVQALEQRARDDDAGLATASARIAREVTQVITSGSPLPDQLKAELALARFEIDRLYEARASRIRNFLAGLDEAQDAHEAKHGETRAWSRGVERVAGDPSRLSADVAILVRSGMARTLVHTSRGLALCLDGDPAHGTAVARESIDETRRELLELSRRLKPLAVNDPAWVKMRRGLGHLHQEVRSTSGMLEEHVVPQLRRETELPELAYRPEPLASAP